MTAQLTRPLVLLLVLPLVAIADPSAEVTLQGTWRDADRKSLIDFSREPDGSWSGTIIRAPRPAEVGKRVFRKLVYDAKTGVFSGLMIKPDDDDGATMAVTLTLTSRTSATATVRKFIFSKTISLTREDRSPQPSR